MTVVFIVHVKIWKEWKIWGVTGLAACSRVKLALKGQDTGSW